MQYMTAFMHQKVDYSPIKRPPSLLKYDNFSVIRMNIINYKKA